MGDLAAAPSASAHLDSLAKTLVGAVVAVVGLLTALGVSDERIWALLDDEEQASRLTRFAFLAVVTIFCGMAALLVPPDRVVLQITVLTVGAALYVASLLGVISVVAEAGDRIGVPTLTSISVDDGALDFVASGVRLDADQSISVRVDADGERVFDGAFLPDELGVVQATAHLDLPASTSEVLVVAFRTGREPACDDIRRSGPSCVLLTVDAEDG